MSRLSLEKLAKATPKHRAIVGKAIADSLKSIQSAKEAAEYTIGRAKGRASVVKSFVIRIEELPHNNRGSHHRQAYLNPIGENTFNFAAKFHQTPHYGEHYSKRLVADANKSSNNFDFRIEMVDIAIAAQSAIEWANLMDIPEHKTMLKEFNEFSSSIGEPTY
ncbi:hypothetical protein AB4238_22240 [Shewanella sp. 10N.286.45.A1]|uniref:hypothetical protein n=1 Tax=Shewanella sp. 10N.286.45.A1 TaxID=3229694 RepID=UPI00354F8BF3